MDKHGAMFMKDFDTRGPGFGVKRGFDTKMNISGEFWLKNEDQW